MGYTRFDPAHWGRYAAATRHKSLDDAFAMHALHPYLDPRRIKVRESRDSAANPNATPIIVALDVTGSMGRVVNEMRKGVGTLFQDLIDRRPVPDPHVLAMGIGDAHCDRAPLQVTQFETDGVVIARQIENIWLERGGGNNCESYNLPWYFAAMRTAIDCVKKGRKGYLFTVGDEEPAGILRADHVNRFLVDHVQRDLDDAELLALVGRHYHVFHIIVEEGSHAASRPSAVRTTWSDLLGQRALPLADHRKLAETVISAIEVNEGRDAKAVAGSWSGDTALVVARAVGGLATSAGSAAAAVVRL